MRPYLLIGIVSILAAVLWWGDNKFEKTATVKFLGVSLEAPPRPIDSAKFNSVTSISPSHVAIIPYSFTSAGSNKVIYDRDHRWWGESYGGVVRLTEMARAEGIEVMIKPHVWIQGQGWAGDFILEKERDWKEWEDSYRVYILDFAVLAESIEVPLFCVGTEYRFAAVKREEFWRQLISEVREVYSGEVTYAANWDNYEKVKFWDALDYIGVDAYFPLDTAAVPSKEDLQKAWIPIHQELELIADKYDKQIIFTEYGYRSVRHTAGPDWELEGNYFNEEAQQIAYDALLQSAWDKQWFAGGFLWKWRFYEGVGGVGDKSFTPQGKRGETTIAKYYRRMD